jgi:hypothetical protein
LGLGGRVCDGIGDRRIVGWEWKQKVRILQLDRMGERRGGGVVCFCLLSARCRGEGFLVM